MTLTQSRTIQWLGIILIAFTLGVGYWYFSVRAGVTTNSGLSQPQGTGRLDSGLAGYWRLDETTGSSASDSSTNGITGTLVNMENGDWVAGQIGNALDFDGTNEYATMTYSSALTSTTGITYSFWASPDLNEQRGILGSLNGEDGSAYNFIRMDNNGAEAGQPKVDIARNIGGSTVSREVQFTYPVSTWFHYVYTYDGAIERVYINGAKLGEWSQTGNFASNTEYGLVLARNYSTGSGNEYDGKLDEVRVYNRALPPDEVTQLYSLTTPTAVDTGLKGYWSFNAQDMNGTTAYDRSGAGNTGTLTNGPTVTKGISGQAMQFNGTNQTMSLASTTFSTASASQAYTINAWIKTTDTDGSIIDQYNGGANRFIFHVYTDNKLHWTKDGSDIAISSVSVNDGQWHMVTGVKSGSGSGQVQLYVDGVASGAAGTDASATENTTTRAPGFGAGGASYFAGSIDEIRVYSRALTAADVRGLYDTGSSDKLGTSAGQAAGTGRLDSGLAGYWKLDDGSGTSAADSSAKASATGTLANGPTWTTGQVGGAVDFDGVNDVIEFTSPLNVVSALTLSAWVKIDNTLGTVATIYSSNCFQYFNGWRIGAIETTGSASLMELQFALGDESDIVVTDALPINTWSHVTAAYGSGIATVYVDGTPMRTVTGLSPQLDLGGCSETRIGADPSHFGSGSEGSPWPGLIDEVRFYDRALGATEVAQLSRLTAPTGVDTGLKGYWSFNAPDMTSTTAYDRSGAGNTGTLQDNAVGSRGLVGQAIALDGSFDRIDVGDMSTLEGQSALTISGWVRPSALVDYAGILCKYSSTTSDTCLQAGGSGVGSNTAINATIRNGSDAYGYTASGKLSVGTWTHVAMVFDGSLSGNANRLKVYVDGVQETLTFSGTIPTTTVSNTQNFIIGRTGGASNYWNGKLDEVRAYNRAFTAAEIQAQYQAAAPDKVSSSVSQPQGSGRLESGLAGYWKLDDGSGSTAIDSSANANNGTLTNFPGSPWTTGQVAGALDFDGTNDYIAAADSDALDFGDSDNFTLSAWFNRDTETTYDWIMNKKNGTAAGYQLSIGQAGDYITFFTSDGTDTYVMYSNTQFTTPGWHHVAITWDNSSESNSRVYIDGVDDTTSRTGTFANVGSLANSTAFSIGENPSDLNSFDGKLDEIRVYNRAFSSDEANQLYRLTSPTGTDSGLKGYWSFNGQDVRGTTAYDRSGAGNNGTLTNGPVAKGGKIGQALSFWPAGSDTDAYVDVPDPASGSLDFGSGDFSVGVWMKGQGYVSQGSSSNYLLSKKNIDTPNAAGYVLAYGSDNIVYFGVGNGTSDFYAGGTVATANDNQWHYYMGVRSGTTTYLYIDGSLVATTTSVTGSTSNSLSLGIGSTGSAVTPSARNVNAVLDEVRIYSRALTAAEIKSLYNSGK